MSSFQSYFTTHEFGFWVGLLLAVFWLAVLLVYSIVRGQRTRSRYDALLQSLGSGNTPAMLAEYLNTVRRISQQSSEVAERMTKVSDTMPSFVHHVGLVRFSPFHDTGGNHSFSLALLDGRGDGIVVSALHSRSNHKLYAKPVIGRSSSYPLTQEEQMAIDRSIQNTPTL